VRGGAPGGWIVGGVICLLLGWRLFDQSQQLFGVDTSERLFSFVMIGGG
jgi:hypothetical protein